MAIKKLLAKAKIKHKIILLFTTIIALGFTLSAFITIQKIKTNFEDQVLKDQNKNILVAAKTFKRDLEDFDVEYNTDGSINRLVLSAIPEFTSHQTIDEIGQMTGETSTLFLWDEESQDFWRRTTNIIKDDGSRAVGTPLGKNGSVYPYMTKGEVYIGEANILGKPYFTRYDPIYFKDSNKVAGILYVGLEKTKFNNYINQIILSFTMMAIIMIAISIFIFLVTFKKIFTSPINHTIKQMQKLSAGDKSFDITGAEKYDEIGDISKALKVFKENALEVERLEEEQKQSEAQRAEERRQATLAMAAKFEERVGSIVQIVEKAASDMEAMSNSLSEAVQKTTMQSSSVASASQEASTNVQTVAAAAEELSASIREISKNVSDTANTAKNCADDAHISQNNLQHLQNAVDEIESVILSINDVAEQTNLLALNATIEAARAGDAGKGFAVVASEVKALAGETHKMTEEISKKVADIKTSANDTISSVNQIINQITSVDDKTTSVAAAIEEQNSSTAEISRNIQEAANGTNEVSNSVEEIQKAANDSSASTEQLNGAAKNLSHQASDLKDAVDSFLKEVRNS